MAYLIPDEKSREELLDWLAWLVQRPDQKLMFAPLLIGPHGTGKSWLADLMYVILGPWNVSTPRKKSIVRDFNGWLARVLLVSIHELKGSANLAEDLKEYITQDMVEINLKGIEAFRIENFANFLCISNHDDAIPIEPGERRYLVIRCASVPRYALPKACGEKPFTPTSASNDYYKRLWDGKGTAENPGDEARRVYSWLLARDIKLDGKGTAPETEARSDLIEAGRTGLENILITAYRDRTAPFNGDVFNLSDVLGDIEDLSQVVIAERNITSARKICRLIGCRPIKTSRAIRLKHGGAKHLWALTAELAASLARDVTHQTLAEMYEAARAGVPNEVAGDFDDEAPTLAPTDDDDDGDLLRADDDGDLLRP